MSWYVTTEASLAHWPPDRITEVWRGVLIHKSGSTSKLSSPLPLSSLIRYQAQSLCQKICQHTLSVDQALCASAKLTFSCCSCCLSAFLPWWPWLTSSYTLRKNKTKKSLKYLLLAISVLKRFASLALKTGLKCFSGVKDETAEVNLCQSNFNIFNHLFTFFPFLLSLNMDQSSESLKTFELNWIEQDLYKA